MMRLKTTESFFFPGFFDEQLLSEIEIFCNIINVFIVTFDRFKPFSLNKSINLFSKINI